MHDCSTSVAYDHSAASIFCLALGVGVGVEIGEGKKVKEPILAYRR